MHLGMGLYQVHLDQAFVLGGNFASGGTKEILSHPFMGGSGDVDPVDLPGRFHAAGRIHRVAPKVELELLLTLSIQEL